MTRPSPAHVPHSDLLRILSAALQTTPVMSRLHDPDHVLSDETARQLCARLERAGIIFMMAADPAPSVPAL